MSITVINHFIVPPRPSGISDGDLFVDILQKNKKKLFDEKLDVDDSLIA